MTDTLGDNDRKDGFVLSKLTEEQQYELNALAREHYNVSLYEIIQINNQFNPMNYDWDAFLDASRDRDEGNWKVAACLACDWRTCPSNQYAIQRESDGLPLDTEFKELGIEFYNCILARDTESARRVIKQMRVRFIRLTAQNN